MAPHRLTIVLGTRPEADKMAPVIAEFRNDPETFQVRVLSTGQHRDMLGPILGSFGVEPNRDLAVMRPGQTLADMTAAMLQAMDEELKAHRPDLLLVQGDTTSVFSAALAAFYARVPVGHVEAGLRSHDLDNPFPEEANRRLTDVLTDLDVLREGIGLVGFGGRDPLVEYQRQSYEMWQALQAEIKAKVVQDIFRVAPVTQQTRPRLMLQRNLTNVQAGRGTMPTVDAQAAAQRAGDGRPQPQRGKGRPTTDSIPGLPLHISQYDGVGRNDPCPCGSGLKYKLCCGRRS